MAKRNRKPRPRAGGSSTPASSTPDARGPAAAGARVARVAVDDETWAAFRELCGRTPASVRLGDLVRAEVARAKALRDPAGEALDAVRVIGDRAAALEAFIRRQD